MSSANHETNRPPVDHDVEIRVRNFQKFTITALGDFTILIVLVWPLWGLIKAISTLPMPFPLRWACIVMFYFEIITKMASLFQIVSVLAEICMPKIENGERSRNRDLGTRTSNLDDWMLANFCAIFGLSTIGFVARYWIGVIALTLRSIFYWTCTMGGLCLIFWLLIRTLRFYRKAKGLKHEETWAILVRAIVIRLYDGFEWSEHFLKAGRFLSETLKGMLDVIGFQIGRGPLFDRLPDEWKAARRDCKTWDDVANFFGPFGGVPDEEGENEKDSQHRNDMKEVYLPPFVFEYLLNPVIFALLRGEHLHSLDSSPSVAKDTSDHHLMNTAEEIGELCADMAVGFDEKGIPEKDQHSPAAPRHTGPATMSVSLSSFACPHCDYIASKKFKLNKHVNQKHNHRFRCVYHGCAKTYGLRTNLERHEATHTGGSEFRCPNPWCKTPEKIFPRRDNLQRHMRRCVISE